MSLRLKAGANPHGLQPETLLIVLVVQSVYAKFIYDCEITSLYDDAPGRLPNSLHRRDGICRAVDFKTKHIQRSELVPMLQEIKLALGTYGQFYDFIYEPEKRDATGNLITEECFHGEYDPKG